MNSIIKLLNIEEENLEVVDLVVEGTAKTLYLEAPLSIHYCPKCGCIMHSHSKRTRRIKHSMLQDGYELFLCITYRHWKCSNQICNYICTDSFNFVRKKKRTTNALELMVVNEFRNIEITAAEIGRKYNVSSQHALNLFDHYVKMERLPLPEILCIDEVYLDMDPKCKYVLVLQNFSTGEPIDLVVSRRKETTEPYFLKIPLAERRKVKFLISDMYQPYLNYAINYFPNALTIVDSFHVMQWILRKLDNYLRGLLKQFKERDQAAFDAIPEEKRKQITVPPSDEVYLLTHYRWLLLSNRDKVDYYGEKKKNYHFNRMMDNWDYEDMLFALNPNIEPLYQLKELYVSFNKSNAGKPEKAAIELDQLIDLYTTSGYEIFEEFGTTLSRYRQSIINSFIQAEKICNGKEYYARLSNGPMESINRKIKDAKRNGRGYTNFNHIRNRFLFATRTNPPLNGRG